MTEQTFIIIKKPQEMGLEDLLTRYKKSQLLEMGESLAVTFPKSWKKGKLIESLADKIVEQAQTIYNEVLEQVIDTLPDKEQTMYYLETVDSIKNLAPLIKKGFFFAAETDEGFVFIVPKEVIGAVESAKGVEASAVPVTESLDDSNDEVVENVSTHQAVKSLTKWKNQLLSIYGTYSTSHLQSIWNRYYSEELSLEEIDELVSK